MTAATTPYIFTRKLPGSLPARPREVHQVPLITGSLTPRYRIGLALLALIGFRLTHGSPITDHQTD